MKGHLDAGNGAGGTLFDVVGNELGVIHLVDVIAGQDEDVFGILGEQNVEVLKDGICRAPIPRILINALLGWQEIDELIDLAAQERPSTLEVPQQTVGFVLGEHTNAPHTRVHAV